MKRNIMLVAVAGPLYVVILTASIWILLRGHNEPGGGFIGGLLAVTGSILWALAHGTASARRRLPLRDPLRLGAAGVLMSLVSGLPALLAGHAFLRHPWIKLPLGFTELPVSSVMLFDIGVYFCVWGALAGVTLALLELDEAANEEALP